MSEATMSLVFIIAMLVVLLLIDADDGRWWR